jgi:hypothetical protein
VRGIFGFATIRASGQSVRLRLSNIDGRSFRSLIDGDSGDWPDETISEGTGRALPKENCRKDSENH